MAGYQILIVHDKIKARKELSGLLDTLALDIEVASVPSGEEALLELRDAPFDLIVTNYSLPGIDGYELLRKAKKQHPGLYGILIISENQDKLPRNPDQNIVDAYLENPIEPAVYLDTVKHCLSMLRSVVSISGINAESKQEVESVSSRLARLRQTLMATTALLLDNTGVILVCAGSLPEQINDGLLMQPVIDSFCAGMKIAKSLKAVSPFTFQFFCGPAHDLILAQVGQKNALLVILDPINLSHELSDIVLTISEGVDDLHQSLYHLGMEPPQETEPAIKEVILDDFVDEAELLVETPRIEALLQERDINTPKTEELDSFWRSITEEETINEVSKADMLTYEQALQLGLAPEE